MTGEPERESMRKIVVVGAGTMGCGIAEVCARAGCSVALVDIREDAVSAAPMTIRSAQEALIGSGMVTAKEASDSLARIAPTGSLEEACADVNLLIEAVNEDLNLKQSLFGRFESLCGDRAILASNTSGLSITEIASATSHPGRVAGLHFWNPPHVIPLVEVIRGSETEDLTAERLLSFTRFVGKKPILVKRDVPGFVGNRLQFAVLREAFNLLSQGIASAEDIDTAMTAGPGLRYALLGPLRTADLGGLDVFRAICSYLFADLCSDTQPPEVLKELVDSGKYGSKTGEGFYQYGADGPGAFLARRDRVLLEFLKVLDKEDRA